MLRGTRSYRQIILDQSRLQRHGLFGPELKLAMFVSVRLCFHAVCYRNDVFEHALATSSIVSVPSITPPADRST